jgi:surface antigen
MIKLEVTPNHYYQERYENNGYRITNGPMRGYLIWKDGEIVRAVNTIQEAEEKSEPITGTHGKG